MDDAMKAEMQRRAGEAAQAFPHIVVPFTMADRDRLIRCEELLTGISETMRELHQFVSDLDPSTMLAGLFGGNNGPSNPMQSILGSLVK